MRKTDNHNRMLRRRIGSMLLSLMVAVSMMPVFAFAGETPAQESEAISPEVLTEEAQPEDQGTVPETADPENDADTGSAGTESADTEVIGEEQPVADSSKEEQAEEPAAEFEFQLIKPSVDLPDSDELLEQYLEKQAAEETAASSESGSDMSLIRKQAKLASRSSRLNYGDKILYDGILAGAKKIAAGETSVAKMQIRMTAAEASDCDFGNVINCLLADSPYEFYWYDKTVGVVGGYKSENLEFVVYFSVAKAYRSSKAPTNIPYKSAGKIYYFKLYETDTSRTLAASEAAANASSIIEKYAALSDVEKLHGYRKEICSLTSYNNTVTLSSDYGDPWQLIYVFDNMPETEVVCEGYAKAFKFLCDLSSFQSDIESHIVTGYIPAGPHMWNIVSMDDGGNYIADITNCDSNYAPNSSYFLRGYDGIGAVHIGYRYGSIKYIYDEETLELYSDSELTLSNTNYKSGTMPQAVHVEYEAPTCEATGVQDSWVLLGNYYSDASCSSEKAIPQKAAIIGALGHSWPWKTTKAATCTANGSQQRTCSRCGKSESRTIASLGHNMKTSSSLDCVLHKCSRCSYSYTVSKVIIDLPSVSIKKPAKAKAAFTAKWKKPSSKNRKKIAGIEIQYSTNKQFTDATSKVVTAKKTATSKKFKKLARKKTYYVRVRSYKWISGKKHVSKWSSIKSVKTK